MTTSDDPSLDFSDLPPFPSDVETAPLLRISLQKILDYDPSETSRLWDACCDVGFFYLDLRDARGTPRRAADREMAANGASKTNGHSADDDFIDGNTFLDSAEQLFKVAEVFFGLPVEERLKYDFKDKGSYHGYKGYGQGIIDKTGTRDRSEFYNNSKDDILSISPPVPKPECLEQYRPLLASYMRTSHAIIRLLLGHLDTALHLPPDTLEKLHAFHTLSGDQVRFVRAPPQPHQDARESLGAHTDFGSMTLLFNRLGGLQILPPSSDGKSDKEKADMWQYVRPQKGHCIVNLGDAMVKFTRGILRSNIHRVVNPPGEQASSVRYSLVYFSRPNEEVMLQPLEESDLVASKKGLGVEHGEAINSRDWVLKRALGRRGNVDDFNKSAGTEGDRSAKEISVK